MRIVPVDEGNVAYAVALGQELVSKSTFGATGPAFDWQHTLNTTRVAARSPDYYVWLSQHDDGTYTGFVGGHVAPFFFSPKLVGIEDAWYVREGSPDRTRAAMMLMRGFVKWAMEERGALMVQSGEIAAIASTAVDSLYKHLGFTRFGSLYKYDRRNERDAA